MAQIGEGHETPGAAPQVLTFDAPSVGEILADRYQIEAHIGNDSLGRQLYRGSDVVLRRPVTVVLRQPGGEAASEMLAAAVAASRVVHPHLVGVYDAIDEGDRAYVVREWIDGVSLQDAIIEGPVDPGRAVAIAWAVADAVAALHATGVVHGNVHPGTVMIAQDGRVMLADARADDAATAQADVRAVGGVLYCALTGFWPHDEAGPAPVADGIHDDGQLVAPRQLRDDVSPAVDELTTGLLDLGSATLTAAALSAELAVLSEATTDRGFDDEGSLGFAAFDAAATAGPSGPALPTGRRMAIGIGALVALALMGTLAATQFELGAGDGTSAGNSPTTTTSATPGGQVRHLTVKPNKVRIVDPDGDRTELRDAALTVDGNIDHGWSTQDYTGPEFGRLKPGMGVLLDLENPRQLANVQVDLSQPGATVELLVGDTDPGNGTQSKATDTAILSSYRRVGEQKPSAGVRVAFPCDEKPVRYVLVWITKLPAVSGGQFGITVNEITINAP